VRILRLLGAGDGRSVCGPCRRPGGHVLARFLSVDAAGPAGDLLASKDIDFEGGPDVARQAVTLVGGSPRTPSFDAHTPNTGIVMFRDSDGVQRRIDFLVAPLGLDASDVRKTAIEPEVGSGHPPVLMWVMHPERRMESRICNVQILGIDDDHAMAQLRASIEIAREWSRLLLGDESLPAHDRVGAVLHINEQIFRRCVGNTNLVALHAQRGIDPFDPVLNDDRLPEAFRHRRYPQMCEVLSERMRRTSG